MAKEVNEELKGVESSESFLNKFKYMFSDHEKLFEIVGKEKGIGASLLTVLIAALVTNVISMFFLRTIMGSISRSLMGSFGGLGYLGFSSFLSPVFTLVGILIGTFIYASLIHMFSKAFKGQASYKDSFNVLAYSMVPALIIGIIPIVGLLAWIYTIYLSIVGISQVHQISKGNASLAVLLPLLIFILILVGLVITVFMAFSRAF